MSGMRRIRRCSPLLAVALLAVTPGCADRAGDAGTRTGISWLDEPHDVVNLELSLDSANSVSRVITETGGTITATGEDGSFFTLEIPAGALHSPERITVTPVRRVDGLPLEEGGPLATVQLEPEGLWFDVPATLTIEVEKPVPEAERVGFAWIAQGHDAHLYPTGGGDSLEMVFKLVHFSGYGFGKAPASDPGRIHLQNAASHAARLEARLAGAVSQERVNELLGRTAVDNSAALGAEADKFLVEYYDGVVRPTMKIAETDDRMAECALRFYIQWLRVQLLLGMGSENDDKLAAAGDELAKRRNEGFASSLRIMEHGQKTAFDRALKQCREEHDFLAYSRVVAVHREMALFGDTTAGSNMAEEMERFMDSCMRFEVEFVSDVNSRLPNGSSRYQVVSTARYVMEPAPSTPFKGMNSEEAAPLNYRTFEISGNPMRDVMGALGSENASGRGDLAGDMARFIEKTMYYNLSKRGTRHGMMRIADIHWEIVKRDTVGTDCAGEDEKQEVEVTDSIKVTLRVDPPTEIVRFTPVTPSAMIQPFNSDMHEWMRFFTQFRELDADSAEVNDLLESSGDDTAGERSKLVTIKLKRIEPGVWRGEFDTPAGTTLGAGLSESGHIIMRHTPK